MFRKVITLSLIVSLSACAPSVWHSRKGPTDPVKLESDKDICHKVSYFARDNPGFYAYGPNTFVLGMTAGYALNSIASTASSYENCMYTSGYTPGAN